MVRQVAAKVQDEVLADDLRRYCKMAVELGAADAKIIAGDDVIFDIRSVLKCSQPKCNQYGTNINCPPHTTDMKIMEEAVKKYRRGILFKIEVPSECFTGADAYKRGAGRPYHKLNHKIGSMLESAAFYDGYYFAMALAGGPCKNIFCPDEECSALQPGQGCRAGLKARSSMEAVGIDVMGLVAKIGWEIYPCGRAAEPGCVPHGLSVGLVLVV